MRNKTAIELVIDDLQESVNRMRSMPTTDYISGAYDAKVRIIKLLKELLEKEKQQVTLAYNSGQISIFNLIKQAFPDYPFSLTQDEIDKIESGVEPNEDAEKYYKEKYCQQ